MKLNYSSNITPVIAKTEIERSSIDNSFFFVYKEDGYVDYKITVNKDIAVNAYVNVIRETNKRYTLEANTTNIIGSDIVYNDTVYFYKVFVLGGNVDLKDLLLNSEFGIIYKDKEFYTNSVITNYEITEGVYIFSKPVIEQNRFNFSIKNKNIELTIDRQNDNKLYFKTKYVLSIQPNYISDNKLHLDTCSIIKDRKTYIAVEGDIRLTEKREYNSSIGNTIKCKDLIVSSTDFYSSTYNQMYTDEFYYTPTSRKIITYTAKISNHVFNIKDELNFKFENNCLIPCEKEESDFTITKVYDYSKIHFELNNYLNSYLNILKEREYIFSNSTIEDNRKIGLKELRITSFKKFPSERYYISQDNSVVFQHTNKTLSDLIIPTIDLLTDNIRFNKNKSLYDSYKFIKLKGINYYKDNYPYQSNMITEDYQTLETENTSKFVLE